MRVLVFQESVHHAQSLQFVDLLGLADICHDVGSPNLVLEITITLVYMADTFATLARSCLDYLVDTVSSRVGASHWENWVCILEI